MCTLYYGMYLSALWNYLLIELSKVHFDITQATQEDILNALIETEQSLPESMSEMSFKGRKITFPIVLDDRWTKEALIRYMQTMRAEAVYLPSNIDYLAKCNGIKGGAEEALKMLVSSPWVRSWVSRRCNWRRSTKCH